MSYCTECSDFHSREKCVFQLCLYLIFTEFVTFQNVISQTVHCCHNPAHRIHLLVGIRLIRLLYWIEQNSYKPKQTNKIPNILGYILFCKYPEFFKPSGQSLDISGDLHLLLEKQKQACLMIDEGNVFRTELIIYPFYLVNNNKK